MLGRLQGAWRELDGDQRLAGLAALALLVTMFLPWYRKNLAVGSEIVSDNLSAFSVFTFVEAAVLLVALGIFLLLFSRGERRAFHLPGGDGTVIFAAGLWAALLLLWRVFDRPDVEGRGATVGITWGFFFAFLAAAALAAVGWRIRAAGRPEPPLERDEVDAGDGPGTAATEVVPRRRRPPARPSVPPSEQLTLEDATEEEAPPRAAPPRPDEAPTRRGPTAEEEPPTRAAPAAPADDEPPARAAPAASPDDEPPTRTAPADDEPATRAAPAAPADDEPPRRAAPPDAPPPPARRESLWSQGEERREDEPRRDQPPPRPTPPPLRPGVFDQDAQNDEPLRPGEVPRRAPD